MTNYTERDRECDLYAERTTTAEKSCKALAAALEAMLNRPSLKLLDPKLLSNSWLVNAQSALTDYRKVNPR